MKDSQAARWLLGQLPGLVEQGVLAPEAAASLQKHYEKAASSYRPQNVAIIVCTLIGAALIGGGIILLIAHNWDFFNHTIRAVISFLPLVTAVGLTGVAVFRKPCSRALAEGAGIFHVLAIGATISLISQTYHISGEFADFLFAWLLLAFPLAYILGATAPALLYMAGVVSWTCEAGARGSQMLWAWALFVLVVPAWFLLIKENRHSIRAGWFSAALAISIPIMVGIQYDQTSERYGILLFTGLSAMFYMVWSLWFSDRQNPHSMHPFHLVGAAGIAAQSIILSYDEPWTRAAGIHTGIGMWLGDHTPIVIVNCVLAFLVVCIAIVLWGFGLRRGVSMNRVAGALPIAVLAASFLRDLTGESFVPMILMNLYALGLGVSAVLRGMHLQRIGTLNAGLVILAALIVSRFFDSDINFLARGIGFIVIGAGFLLCNSILIRKRKTVAS